MKKNAIVSLTGADSLEMVAPSEYKKIGNKHIITYQESDITNMNGTTTTLEASDGEITITRRGTTNSLLAFTQGKRHLCQFSTQHGDIFVGISAHSVNVNLGEDGGEVSAHYAVDVDNVFMSNNDFIMKVQVTP